MHFNLFVQRARSQAVLLCNGVANRSWPVIYYSYIRAEPRGNGLAGYIATSGRSPGSPVVQRAVLSKLSGYITDMIELTIRAEHKYIHVNARCRG